MNDTITATAAANRAYVRDQLDARYGVIIPLITGQAIAEARYEPCPRCGGWRPRTDPDRTP